MLTTAILSVALLPCTRLSAAPPGEDPFERRTLSNGVELCVLQAPRAPRQALFTFLPLGLLRDGPGQAQCSHLVEHMLIRSTDPDSLRAGGILLNGETTGDLLRLETIGPVAAWREAAARHPRWLAARAFDGEALAREKVRIEGEEASTVPRAATGKWAQAAWSQVVRGGLEHAAVHGDVAAMTLAGLEELVAARVRVGPGVRIVASGPVGIDELAAFLEAAFDSVPAPADDGERSRARGGEGTQLFRPGLREATWDLDAAHYLEWYPLPDGTPADAAFALVLEGRVGLALAGSGHTALKGGRALAGVRLRAPGARALSISVPVEHDVDVEALQAAIRTVLEPLRAEGAHETLALARMQYAFQLGAMPDFEALRARLAENPAADMIEAQTALTWSTLELTSGLTLPELHAALNALELEAYGPVLAESLAVDKRCALMLAP